jgi:hypothetical protein
MMSYCILQLILAKTYANAILAWKNEYDIIIASGTEGYPSGTKSREKMRPKLQQNHSLRPMQRHHVAMNISPFSAIVSAFLFILM